MSNDSSPTISVFWSWQSDLPSEATRNLVEDALRDAAKQVQRSNASVVAVDRDTKGEPGTPAVADTILRKIAHADVFVWDASIVLRNESRSAPNPNVLFELGFAVAALGWERVVGVMNTHFGAGEELPFDLRHRRWPIQYSLPPRPEATSDEDAAWKEARKLARGALSKSLAEALNIALAAPKGGLLRTDLDAAIARKAWQVLPSSWLHTWHEWRQNYPQFEEKDNLDRFRDYVWRSSRPELAYKNPDLRKVHIALVDAIQGYLVSTAREMVPYNSPGQFVISTKKNGESRWIDRYDELYDRQVDIITNAASAVWEAWIRYVERLRLQHPDVALSEDGPS